jgi:peptidoglycan hydrolase CwlO-like protein
MNNIAKSYTLKKLEIDLTKANKELDKLNISIKEHDNLLKDKKERVVKLKSELEQLNNLKNCL